MLRFLRAFLVLLVCCPALIGQTVHVYQTTPDFTQAIQQQTDTQFGSNGSGSVTLTIDDSRTYQQMDGFGASMTDASGWVIAKKLSAAQQTEVMTKLFDRTNGIALRFLRIPMGSSDESVTVYSYDDLCTPTVPTSYCTTPNGSDGKMLSDPTLSKFSIAHDEDYIIPLLKQARDLAKANGEKLWMMANPWSPPGWMKTNGSMLGVANGVTGNLKPEAYDPLAQYFVKFVQGYAADGLHIDYISMQNEPQYAPADYSGMIMSSSDQANFLANYIAPAFANADLDAKFMVWDHNWDNQTYPKAVLSDANASKYAAGVAWHHYAGDPSVMSVVHDLFPDKDVWETEASMIDSDSLARVGVELINSTRNWAKSYVLWDLANDQNHGPHVGGCGTCRPVVTVDYSDPANVKYILTTDYYALGQASKFVVPGAYHIYSDEAVTSNIYDVAFRNPDGSIIVYVTNNGPTDKSVNIKYAGMFATSTVKANSIATFVWSPQTASTVSLSQQPNGLTVPSGQSGTLNLTITPLTGTPTVSLGCQVVDLNGTVVSAYSCSVDKSNFTFADSSPVTATVTFRPATTASVIRGHEHDRGLPLFAFTALPLTGLVFAGASRKRRILAAVALLVVMSVVLVNCGGGGSTGGTTPPPPPQTAAVPVFVPPTGSYAGSQVVTISSSTVGATIYYTNDGSTPTASSTKYTGPVTVSSAQTLKAIATAAGYTNSSVSTAAYTITAPSNVSMIITATTDTGTPVTISAPVLVKQ